MFGVITKETINKITAPDYCAHCEKEVPHEKCFCPVCLNNMDFTLIKKVELKGMFEKNETKKTR